MPEEFVSPGVFTEENDQSFLQQGVSQISGVFVGPTQRGPAFTPTLVESVDEYERIFGLGDFYTDFAVKNYLEDAGSAYVVRLLGEEGHVSETIELVLDASSAPFSGVTDDFLLGVLAPTQAIGDDKVVTADVSNSRNSVTDFELDIGIDNTGNGNADDTVTYVLSLNPSDQNYFQKVFGTSPQGAREVYVKENYPGLHEEILAEEGGGVSQTLHANSPSEDKIQFDGEPYSTAETPWIKSQDLLPNQPNVTDRRNLFKFVTLSHGNDVNQRFKIGVRNVTLPGNVPGTDYGNFDVVVRDIEDTDRRPDILEIYSNVNLNPSSPRYLPRVIGDRYTVFTEEGKVQMKGDWPNNSDLIRVEMNPDVVDANDEGLNDLSNLVPWGFGAYEFPIEYSSAPFHGLQTVTSQGTVDDSSVYPQRDPGSPDPPFDNRKYLGFDFNADSNYNFLAPVGNKDNISPSLENTLDALDTNFSIDDAYPDAFGEYQEDNQGNRTSGTEESERRFLVGFQGGYDGKDPSTPIEKGEDITAGNTQGFDCSGQTAPGSQAYNKAFGIMSNTDQYDINLLVTPGIIKSLHSSVVADGIDLVEGRRDAFYIFDCVGVNATVSEAANSINNIDSNYAGTYYPWVRAIDNNTNRLKDLPPSVVMPRVYAFNDQVAAEWFAPAGLNRGGIPEAREAVSNLTKAERDTLYDARVNPIASFPDEGIVAWGQKTTQALPSALDRINVRRLLIRVKKFIASASRFLVFEQNTAQTRAQFRNIVNPYLDTVQQRQGLYAFRVKMDSENNPPEVIDRNQLVGELFLQPARTSEFVSLTFNILPTGATFGG